MKKFIFWLGVIVLVQGFYVSYLLRRVDKLENNLKYTRHQAEFLLAIMPKNPVNTEGWEEWDNRIKGEQVKLEWRN